MKSTCVRLQLDEFRIAFLILAILSFLAAFSPAAAQILPTDERGCYAIYNSTSGKFSFEPFLKVAEKDATSEDGTPEVWGFRVWNLDPPKEDGKTYPVNIPETRYIKAGVFKEVPMSDNDHRKKIRCPDYQW